MPARTNHAAFSRTDRLRASCVMCAVSPGSDETRPSTLARPTVLGRARGTASTRGHGSSLLQRCVASPASSCTFGSAGRLLAPPGSSLDVGGGGNCFLSSLVESGA